MNNGRTFGIVNLVIIIIVFALTIISLALPWYSPFIYTSGDCKFSRSYSWFEIVNSPQSTCNSCTSFDKLECLALTTGLINTNWRMNCTPSTSASCNKLPQLFDGSFAMMLIAMLLALILAIITFAFVYANKVILSPILTFTLGLFTGICLLIAVIILSVGIPDVKTTDANGTCQTQIPGVNSCTFIGSFSLPGSSITVSWGPAAGWIIAVVAAGLAEIFGILELVRMRMTDYSAIQ